MNKIISFGGGVNSVAMTILLYGRGERWPIVISDTGVEQPETYCYLDTFDEWLKDKYGIIAIRVSKGESLETYCLERNLVPSAGFRWCTDKFKKRPIEKAFGNRVISLIGIAADESHRAKPFPLKEYPLVDEGITREGCKEIIRATGLPMPKKSGCYFCPFQSMGEWKRLYENHPDLWDRAKRMESEANKAGRGMATFIPNGTTLLQLEATFKGQGSFGFPDVPEDYMSCMCGR
jgi:3'-phosphoadenosine 5'-phosphosulfate sulfotransferase (PAPS reductase)/FAD synthetase